MRRQEYMDLLSRRVAVRRMLDGTPEEFVIDRASMQGQLDAIQRGIDQAQIEREPATMQINFKGKPVVGTEGIVADFGAKALEQLNELVATLAASGEGTLRDRGPIPNREQHQLLITATTRGSFGFELQEHVPEPLPAGDETATQRAMSKAHALLRGVAGTDDDLADAANEVEPRAIEKLRSFLQTMADAQAWCSASFGDLKADFPSLNAIQYGLERIKQENLPETETVLEGRLLGALPIARTFEFERATDQKVIRGKVAASFADVEKLNDLRGQTIRIRVLETRVGKGSVRYRLLDVPADVKT
jgi:hypothetical protein